MLCGRYVTASRNTFYNGTSMAPIQLFSDSREAVLFGFVLPGCVAVSFNKKNEHGTLPQGNPGLSNPQRQRISTLVQIKKARVA